MSSLRHHNVGYLCKLTLSWAHWINFTVIITLKHQEQHEFLKLFFPGVLSFFFFSGRIQLPGNVFRSETLNYYWMPIIVSHKCFIDGTKWTMFQILSLFDLALFSVRWWCSGATSSLTDSSVCTTCVSTRSSSASVSRCLQFCQCA